MQVLVWSLEETMVQLAIGTDDVYKTAPAVEMQKGVSVRPPGALPGLNTKIYGCTDPEGFKIVSWKIYLTSWSFYFLPMLECCGSVCYHSH